MSEFNRLFFDIETVADKKAVKMLPSPNPPKNYKDEKKIEAWIADKQAEMLAKAALDPDTARIKAIGWRVNPDGEDIVKVIKPTNKQEKDLLLHFWQVYAECTGQTVGYNTIGFDFPVILRRSMQFGLLVPKMVDLRPYQLDPTTDLMRIMYGTNQWKGQKWVAYRYGIDTEPDERGGGDVAGMTTAEIVRYLKDDVRRNVQLWQMMNGIYFQHQVVATPRPTKQKK